MSDYGSVDDIKRKIGDGVYKTFVKSANSKNELWKYFEGMSTVPIKLRHELDCTYK